MTWATGQGGGVDHRAAVLSRAGFQQGNIQRRNPFCHIVHSGEKVNICQKAVEVLHLQSKSAGFIKPAHIPKMYIRSRVS